MTNYWMKEARQRYYYVSLQTASEKVVAAAVKTVNVAVMFYVNYTNLPHLVGKK